ncbi:MAG TPA: Hsp20/alpha crystallin family protein [Chitinophagaceae bacterium]|jgi:HSP20 family protein|nr:Hsp20/alpha crystallin family protein [Chitinophagaceae bacterium]
MVTTDLYYPSHSAVYPGEYEPLPWKDKQVKEAWHEQGYEALKPPVNIREYPDHYRIEMPVPGFERDDFFLLSNGKMLLIKAVNKVQDLLLKDHPSFAGFLLNECIYQEIQLPGPVDPDFVTAELKGGILLIHLLKTSAKPASVNSQIIVY